MSKEKGAKKPAKKAGDSAEGFSRTKTIGNDPIIRVNTLEIDTTSEHIVGYVSWGRTLATSLELRAFAIDVTSGAARLAPVDTERTDGIAGKLWGGLDHTLSGQNGAVSFFIKCEPLSAHKAVSLIFFLTSKHSDGSIVSHDVEMLTLFG